MSNDNGKSIHQVIMESINTTRKVIGFTVISLVSSVTVVSITGLWIGVISMPRSLFLSGINILLGGFYLRIISPNRNEIPPIVTSLLGLIGAILVTLTLSSLYQYTFFTILERISATIWQLFILGGWIWFVVLYLGDFHDDDHEALRKLNDMIGPQN